MSIVYVPRLCRSPRYVRTTPLPISEVTKLLQDPPEEGISSLPPVKAKAGEIYL